MGPRRQIMFPLFGDGIFTQDGPEWKRSRELLRPQFSYRCYQNLDIFREHVDNLISSLPPSGQIVDLQPLFFRLTLDTTTRSEERRVGKECNCQREQRRCKK